MSAATPQIFSGITPAKYALLMERAQDAGLPMNGNSGRASRMGVEVEWNYSPEEQQLVLTCHRAPLFMSVESVNSKIHELVSRALQS